MGVFTWSRKPGLLRRAVIGSASGQKAALDLEAIRLEFAVDLPSTAFVNGRLSQTAERIPLNLVRAAGPE